MSWGMSWGRSSSPRNKDVVVGVRSVDSVDDFAQFGIDGGGGHETWEGPFLLRRKLTLTIGAVDVEGAERSDGQ